MNSHLTDAADLDAGDIESLRFQQWSVPQFCMAVLDKLLPCLKGIDEEFTLHAVTLLQSLLALLSESLVPDLLWHDDSQPAKQLVGRHNNLQHSLHVLKSR